MAGLIDYEKTENGIKESIALLRKLARPAMQDKESAERALANLIQNDIAHSLSLIEGHLGMIAKGVDDRQWPAINDEIDKYVNNRQSAENALGHICTHIVRGRRENQDETNPPAEAEGPESSNGKG